MNNSRARRVALIATIAIGATFFSATSSFAAAKPKPSPSPQVSPTPAPVQPIVVPPVITNTIQTIRTIEQGISNTGLVGAAARLVVPIVRYVASFFVLALSDL